MRLSYILENKIDQYFYSPDDEFDDGDIDQYEIAEMAYDLAKDSGIYISRDKDLSHYLLDKRTNKVIGASFSGISDNEFQFDVVIDPNYRQKGLATRLIKNEIEQYKYNKSAISNLKMVVYVVNPYLIGLLKKMNFKIISKTPDSVTMQYMDQ